MKALLIELLTYFARLISSTVTTGLTYGSIDLPTQNRAMQIVADCETLVKDLREEMEAVK